MLIRSLKALSAAVYSSALFFYATAISIFAALEKIHQYEAVIGLEVHAQLRTQSKLFCGDSTAFGAQPNTQVSPVSLAHHGTLPVMNKAVTELAVKLGLALQCTMVRHNYFARKNYFYPDLPKAYQVSQHTAPICRGGFLTLSNHKKVLLNRIHIEEDAGKSIHDLDEHFTYLDFNRAGIPLLEIVTEPCIHSAADAYDYLTQLRRLVRWLGVCNGNMEEGSMRCDANISIRLKGETKLGTRVEVKNLNSIRHVKLAIDFEINRLIELTENGKQIVQQTRSFDAEKGTTFSLRTKEDAEDYRYFPEPDLPPIFLSEAYLQSIQSALPVLPEALFQKYTGQFQLAPNIAQTLCADKEDADFFERLLQHTSSIKAAANWVVGPVKSYCNEHQVDLSNFPLSFSTLADLISLVESGKLSFGNASGRVFQTLINQPGRMPEEVAIALNLMQEKDEAATEAWVNEVMNKMPEKVKEYQSGKKGLMGLFAGEVKKLSKGKADMAVVNKILLEKLN